MGNLIFGIPRVQYFNGLVEAAGTENTLFIGTPFHFRHSVCVMVDGEDALRFLEVPNLAGMVRRPRCQDILVEAVQGN